MEVKLNVSVELGPQTLGLISAFSGVKAAEPTASVTPKNDAPAPKEEKARPGRPAKTDAPKKEEAGAADFDGLDDDAKLEAIKTEVTKHTKKGKSADIKALLTAFDAGRASELATDRYDEFYAAIVRYGKGETVEAITGGGDDDLN